MSKVSKASVRYRLAQEAEACGNCAMFHDGTCDLVSGSIDPAYVCDRWVAATVRSKMSDQRKPLSSKERDNLDDSDFAYIDSAGERHFPIHDAAHVKAALSRFAGFTQWDNADDKTAAAKKIVAAAKKFGIAVDPASPVGQAAGLKQQNSAEVAAELLGVDYQTEVLKSLRELAFEMRSGEPLVRSALRQSMRKMREERVLPFLDFEVRAGGGNGDVSFEGFACVTGEDDAAYEMQDFLGSFVESVSRKSFTKTLSEDPDVQMLENHEGRPLCRTSDGRLVLAERITGTPSGLHVQARLNGERHDVHDVVRAIADGTYNQMSMAFRVVRQDWNEAGDRRWIREISLHQGDVSVVGMAANPHTIGTTGIRSAFDPIRARSASRIDVNPVGLLLAHAEFRNWAMGCEWRDGKTLSAATMETLRQVLNSVHEDDDEDRAGKVLSSANIGQLSKALDYTASAGGAIQSVIDSAASGASGNTETESAEGLPEKTGLEAELALMIARNREAERKRRKAA